MRRSISAMFGNRRARDRGDVLLMSIGVLAVSTIFVSFIIMMAYSILAFSKDSQNNTLAQEAADVAVAEAMFVLNEEFGVVSSDDDYDQTLLLRSLPDATDPASADLTNWNATQQRNQHNVGPNGEYGIQAESTWYVDVFDTHFGAPSSVPDPNRIRQSGQIGNLVVASTVFIPQGENDPFVLATRSIEVPLFQYQARAVQRSSDGVGLSYVVSPATMFQFGAVGVASLSDDGDSGSVRLLSPIASNGNISLVDPEASFVTSADRQRRYDSNVFLFGSALCIDGNAAGVTRCDNDATLSLSFEVNADTQLMDEVEEFCGSTERDDFIASEQSVANLLANDTTYCFRDFIMDADVNLISTDSNNLGRTARIFVDRELRVTDGSEFNYTGAAATAPQAAFYTRSSNVTFEGSTTSTSLWAYVYAPDATCELGEMSNPDARSETRYVGSWVCDTVVLDQAYSISHRPPYPGLIEFGEFGFGSDVYLNNLWFVNYEATRAVLQERP